jgi:hypothetical protein
MAKHALYDLLKIQDFYEIFAVNFIIRIMLLQSLYMHARYGRLSWFMRFRPFWMYFASNFIEYSGINNK